MLKSHILKWAAAALVLPAIPVLAKTIATSPAKPAAVRSSTPMTSAESKKLADAIAALTRPAPLGAASHAPIKTASTAKPGVRTAVKTATSSHTTIPRTAVASKTTTKAKTTALASKTKSSTALKTPTTHKPVTTASSKTAKPKPIAAATPKLPTGLGTSRMQ